MTEYRTMAARKGAARLEKRQNTLKWALAGCWWATFQILFVASAYLGHSENATSILFLAAYLPFIYIVFASIMKDQ